MLGTRLKHWALLTAITSLVMLTNLGGPRLWDRDEPRNAGCAREMLARGELVVPYFNGELRTHKPVLLYWCIMAAYRVFGVTEFAARLPSALAAIGSVLCTYSIGRRLFGIRAGLWAGIALATSLMFVVAGRAATPDSLLIFTTTLALAIYIRGTFRPRFETTPLDAPPQLLSSRLAPQDEAHASLSSRLAPRDEAHMSGLTPALDNITRSVMPTLFPNHWPTALALYAVMGLAVLAKGPVGFILPTAVIGLFLLISRLPKSTGTYGPNSFIGLARCLIAPIEPFHFITTCWLMRPFTALFAVLAVALPWYWAVGLATDGEFLRGFFLDHNLSRATAPMENHGGTILFYPVAILIGFFPWSIFAAPLALDTALKVAGTLRVSSPQFGTHAVPGLPTEPLPTLAVAGLPTEPHFTDRQVSISPSPIPEPRAPNPDPPPPSPHVFALCWIAIYVLLFTLARTKLPSYVTPCYPALALLAGDYIGRWSRQSAAVAGRWLLAAFACLALVGIGIAVAIPLVAKQQLPGEEWLGLIGLLPIAGGVACLGLAAVRSYHAAAASLAATAVTFAVFLFAVGADRLDKHQTNHELLQAIYARTPNPQIAAYKMLEPTWVYYGGRPIHEFTPRPGYPARQAALETAHFLATNPDAFVITTAQKAADLADLLPPGIGPLAQTPYFLHQNQTLTLLGHQQPQPTLTSHHTPLTTHPR